MDSLPTAFGAPSADEARKAIDAQIANNRISSSKRSRGAEDAAVAAAQDVEEDEDLDNAEDEAQANDRIAASLPVSHEAVLEDHSKTVSALSIDPAGARFVTGSYDYSVKWFDFGGMTSAMKSFRSVEPAGNYQIHDLAFNATGEQILVAAGTCQPLLYDREAHKLGEYAKGDMYLRDMKQTQGHVADISSCCWHPRDQNIFLTSAADSTVRIWDVEKKDKSKSTIVLKSKERGGRTRITAATYSPDGSTIAAAALDGTLNLWSSKSNFARPNATADAAHEKVGVSGLAYSLDNHSFVSRGLDGTVKYWDTRKFKKPVAIADGLPNLNAESNIIFSPDDRFIMLGTAGAKAAIIPGRPDLDEQGPDSMGKLVILERDTLRTIRTLSISEGSVVRVAWHPRINQIFCTTSLGKVHVLYSPAESEKGATLALSKVQRRVQQDDITPALDAIMAPEALPMFGDKDKIRGIKHKRNPAEHALYRAYKPQPPAKDQGKIGRIAATPASQAAARGDFREEDPREALLKYDQKPGGAEWTKAWGKEAPTVFSKHMDEVGVDDQPDAKRAKKHKGTTLF